ncbi:MAG: M12 family metallo-peptidase [Saprospiraceae bacterium]
MFRQLLLCVLFVSISILSFAQANPLFQQVEQAKRTQSFVKFVPFQQAKNIIQNSDLQLVVKSATLLKINTTEFNTIKNQRTNFINLTVPINETEQIQIELFAKDVFKKDFIYKNEEGQKLATSPALFYRGVVKNNPNSLVALSIIGDEMMGMISSPSLGNLVIGKLKDGSHQHIIYRDSDLVEQNKATCHSDVLPYVSNTKLLPTDEAKSAACGKVIDIYFEADHLFYQAAGNNEQNVLDYLGGLFNVIATLFQRESIAVRISEIKVWTTPDPYPTTDAEEALFSFRSQLNGQFNGDVAQLLSLYTDEDNFAPNGGLAFIDKLCQSKLLSVSYSNIDGVFRPLPRYSWDAFLITHELGHNFGSPHTHACEWGATGFQSLDNCFETEGNCSQGPAPINGGTIMSYCHVTTNGINFSNGFGNEPGNLIRNRVAAANCLAIGNENFAATIETFGSTNIEEGETIELIANPNDNSYLYQWYRNNVRIEDGVASVYEASEIGEYFVEISKEGCTEISNTVAVTMESLQVSMSCAPSNCTTCSGQNITIDAGVNASNYQWSNGANTRTINVETAGTYSVTVTNNGNSAMGSTTVQFTTASRTDNVEICEGETHTIGNSTYQNTGIYTDLISNNNGCTEEVTTNLTVLSNSEETNVVSICMGESITVGSSTYNQTGNYIDLLSNENGCERRVNTILTVSPTYRNEQEVTICEGGSFTVGNETYTTAGEYEYTFTSMNNCDSVIVTRLQIADNYNIEQDINLCAGESITVGNSTYNATGMYSDELMASDGCDSIVTTNLTIFDNFSIENNFTICTGEQITVGNSTYTQSGTYEDILQTTNGCDSTIMTRLEVLENSETMQSASLCDGEEFIVGGSTYTSSGTYVDLLTNINGCDSTVTTQLTFSDQIVTEADINLCYGEEYNGQVFTESGSFNTTGTSVNGCDSLHILNINVNPVITLDFEVYNISCTENRGAITATANGGTANFTYQWSNGATTATNEDLPADAYELLVTDDLGCTTSGTADVLNESDVQITSTITPVSCTNKRDAAIDLEITNGMPPFDIFWSNGPLSEDQEGIGAGNYSVTISDANDCQFDTTFVIQNPEILVATASATGTDSNTGTASVEVIGGASPYTYNWSNGATTSTIENLMAGDYEVVITDGNGCTTTAVANVDMVSNLLERTDIQLFNLFPNPNTGAFNLQIELAERQEVEVLVYNAIGQIVQNEVLDLATNINHPIELKQKIAGVYWLVLKTEKGQGNQRFIVK